MNLKDFSLLYPTEAARQAHYAGKDAPNIPMVVLDELGLTQIFDLRNCDLSDFFTTDPAVITYRNQTFTDLLNNPTLLDTLQSLVPVLQDITELRRLESDNGEDDTAAYLSSMTEIEL